MYKAILFDMDGLIFDTESVYKTSWQYAATEQGLTITDGFYQQFIGVQDPECERMLAAYFGEKIDMLRYKKVRDENFHALRDKGVVIKSGFSALFQAIQAKGLKMAIVTSSHLPEVEFNFSKTAYLSAYDLIVTAEDVPRGKPHPDCYLLACEKLGIAPKDCLVLEDSNNGARAGLDAGCSVIMVPDLLPPKDELLDKVTVVKQLDQVIALL